MDTNTKTMQINTFAKGMDTDTSDMLINSEAYRLAKNLRYIADMDETTGELRLINGATRLEENINEYIDTEDSDISIRAFNSINNVGALVCQKNDESWSVWRADYINDTFTVTKVFGWCTEPLGQDTKLSTVLKWENEKLLLLYIADGLHKLLKINMYDTSDPVKSDILYISGAVIIPKDSPVIIAVLNGGLLKPGLTQYAYRMYNNNNTSTKLSPLSDLFAVKKTYTEYGPIGLKSDETSTMGIGIEIPIDSSYYDIYPKILIYRIQYLVNGLNPTISLIYDGKIEPTTSNGKTTVSLNDYGFSDLQLVTLEEFNSIGGIDIIPSLIEQKDNYLFAGNIKYAISSLDDDYLKMDFRAFSTGDNLTQDEEGNWNYPSIDTNIVNENLDLANEYDVTKWMDIDGSGKIGGSSDTIQWRFDNKLFYDLQSGGFDDEYKLLNHCPLNDGSRKIEPQNLRVSNDSKMRNFPVKRGLRHDEIYRYGIILYSTTGIQYPVKWIADIRTPKLDYTYNKNDFSQISFVNGDENYEYANTLHVQFQIKIDLSKSNLISGYEIVRARRTEADRATISLGIIAATAKSSNETNTKICSIGMPFIDEMLYYSWPSGEFENNVKKFADTTILALQFYSPESIYFTDQLLLTVTNGDNYSLEVQCPLCPKVASGITANKFSDTSAAYSTNSYVDTYLYYRPEILYHSTSEDNYDPIKNRIKRTYSSTLNFPTFTVNDEDYDKRYKSYNLYKLYPLDKAPDAEFDGEFELGQTYPEDSQIKKFNTKFKINDAGKVEKTDWDKVIVNDDFKGFDKLSLVGKYEFYSIVAPHIICNDNNITGLTFNTSLLKDGSSNYNFRYALIGTCCPSLVLSMEDKIAADWGSIIRHYSRLPGYFERIGNTGGFADDFKTRTNLENNITVSYTDEWSMLCNIRRYVLPYGGFTQHARQLSTYIKHGYYRSADDTNVIDVYDGDTVVRLLEFTSCHKWFATNYNGIPKSAIICQVAVESSIDTDLDGGDRFSNITDTDYMTLLLVDPAVVADGKFTLKNYAYSYNTAYSQQQQLELATNTSDEISKEDNYCPNRVHYSNQAEQSLSLDPWLIFQPLNYLDVDGSRGKITNLRTFKDKLIFWQDKATGILSVNERVQLTDDSNLPLILGTGGVLSRYDYITTNNGMKENQHADTQSEDALYWWDYDKHTICLYAGASSYGTVRYGTSQLSKVKSVQSMLNKAAKDGKLSYEPLLIYDNKYSEILFKLGKLGPNVDEENVLVYSESQALFSSIYDIDPTAYFNFGALIVMINGLLKHGVYKWDERTYSDKEGYTSVGFNEKLLLPYFKYVINENKLETKVYDNVEFAGIIPGSYTWDKNARKASTLTEDITFEFHTPLKQYSYIDGTEITNRLMEFKFAIPRGFKEVKKNEWEKPSFGDRLRGKTMQCELSSKSNSLDFSLQYILTKYRISWS